MLSRSILAFSLSVLTVNVSALPAASEPLEARQNTVLADQIKGYINMLAASGFTPNQPPAAVRARSDDQNIEKRAQPDISQVLTLLENHGFKPAKKPNTTVSVPAKPTTSGAPTPSAPKPSSTTAAPSSSTAKASSTTAKSSSTTAKPSSTLASTSTAKPTSTTKRARDLSAPESELEKRALPDINLVISLLKQAGYYPSGNPTGNTARSIEARQTDGEINTVINQLLDAGYNPADFGPGAASALSVLSLPITTTATCPQDNQTQYVSGGQTYLVNCAYFWPEASITYRHENNIADCAAWCSSYAGPGAPCKSANWYPDKLSGFCSIKNTTRGGKPREGFNSIINLKYKT